LFSSDLPAPLVYYLSLVIVIISNVLYHIAQKSIPQTAHPLVSTILSYCVALALCVVAYFFFPAQQPFMRSVGELNWSSYLLGLSIVGVEIAYLFVYKTGWTISTASLVANMFIAVALIPIGLWMFRDTLTLKNMLGIVLCLLGLWLVSSK
jgi:drug/metabolite transporter (DMT)-like permease